MTSSPQTLAATADTTERLDRCLARLHPEISRARFQRLIAEGQVLVEGQTIVSIADQLFPRFIMNQMPAGLSGLVLAGILSAALSSLSSGLNSSCAVLEKDFFSRRSKHLSSETATVARLKWLTWLIALIAVALSMLNLLFVGNLVERCFKLINLLTAPLFVLFFLALFVPWANAIGAWLGLISSIATAICIAYSKELGIPLTTSFVWIIPCSLLVGVSVGTVASSFTLRTNSEANP